MNQTTSSIPSPAAKNHDEHILVVKRLTLFQDLAWHGLNTQGTAELVSTITHNQEFLPRSLMEQDPTYKQIIPYVIFNFQDRYFVMQRKATASEQRLKNKFSLGIGGHVRQEDVMEKPILDWAHREFHEEINYVGNLHLQPLGFLNDDTNAVGQVHLGFVILAIGDSDQIYVKSELKSGYLLTKDEIEQAYGQLESWSQIVFDHLKNK
ncbi:phosphoesterase [Candidatus Dependentiae bacterium Noda2021]|nr:phosphoesterase [Candidatus Dependentiae bacterium Noda2021]